MYYQQGDVVLTKVNEMPKNLKKVSNVVAEGEVTGHKHRMNGDVSVVANERNELFASVGLGGSTIMHEEHNPIVLPKGNYRVDIVREYDHFVEEARRIAD